MERIKNRVTWRQWLVFIIVGLAGQFAWSIENMYLNSYLYALSMAAPSGQGFDGSSMVAITTALSAVTATLTTIFMGSLTDKLRKRKIFICIGYVLWGLSTAAFGLLDVANADAIVPIAMSFVTAAILVIVIDCVMTFFGSTANDAAFNAYVTKNVQDKDRGKVEGVLSILPLVAMLIIFVALNGLTANGQWDLFFYIVGGLVLAVGILSFFLIPKEKKEEKPREKFLPLLAHGFRPSTIRKHPRLYLILLAYFIYNVAIQVFFPYLMVYVERTALIPNSGSSFLTPFAIVMALALILGSAGSVLVGFFSDRKGKTRMILPTILVLSIGLLMMFFAPEIQNDLSRYAYTAISGIVMILGYVAVPTILNSLVREEIPKGMEGSFMGVRMIFVVALPMCIGPFIGDGLNDAYGKTYVNEYNVETALPSRYGYLVAIFILLLVLIPLFFLLRKERRERNCGYLLTNLVPSEKLDEPKSFRTHPRPYFHRKDYLLLDGLWDYVILKEDKIPEEYQGKIRVPYAVESPYSLVNHLLTPDEHLFYHRKVQVPENLRGKGLLLCFEGVDQVATVYIDKEEKMRHVGGYTRFVLELDPEKTEFDLVVKVEDATDSLSRMTGKQRLKPNGWFYSSSSGILKSVYLEKCGKKRIERIDLLPSYDEKCLQIQVTSQTARNCLVSIQGEETVSIVTNEQVRIDLSHFHPWSIEDPYVYELKVETEDDVVCSSFGVRKFTIEEGQEGKKRFSLNGKRIFLNGLLDQGYYGLGGLTAGSEEDYRRDLENTKKLGFNCLRMHVKIEDERFYDLASRLGILILQDIPNGGSFIPFFFVAYPRLSLAFNHSRFLRPSFYGRKDKEEKERFVKESTEILKDLSGIPSIVLFTIFNEGWGEFEPERLYDLFKPLVPDQLLDTASGWLDSDHSDLFSVHSYTLPHRERKARNGRPYFLSEFGGISLKVKDHFFYPSVFGHHLSRTKEDLQKSHEKLYLGFEKAIRNGDLIGLIYTQLNDCEREANGLFTFDRKVLKLDERYLRELNKKIQSWSDSRQDHA